MNHRLLAILIASLCLFSCEKYDFSKQEENTEQTEGRVKVTFQIGCIEHLTFENTRTSVSDLCSRFSLAIFQGDTKVKVVNQTCDETDFGSITLSLTPGEYQLVAIAHNGLGNCTISSPEKITFKDNKCTDTFWYYGTLDVQESSLVPLTLSRPVSMFRLKILDPIPSNVAQMKFYYTGGSSTFNALTGYGSVNSRQTEIFTLSDTDNSSPSGETEGGRSFEVYTFPHESHDLLDVTITALDSNGTTVAESKLGNLAIQPNIITQHTCTFFTTSGTTDPTTASVHPFFNIQDDGKWADVLEQ